MIINKSIDIEDEVRLALDDYLTVYCRPLPENYTLPHILVTWVGGSVDQTIDTFEVVLDARAKSSAEAVNYLQTAKGILKEAARQQTTAIRYVTENASGSWGVDPVRPDLAMCSARLSIVAHQQITNVEPGDGATLLVNNTSDYLIATED